MIGNIRKTVIDGIDELIAKDDLTAAKLLSAGWHDRHVLTDEEYLNYCDVISKREEQVKLEKEAEELLRKENEVVYEQLEQ